MHYREIQPSAAAAKFVRCYWTLEDDGLAGLQRIVPDGRPELIPKPGPAVRKPKRKRLDASAPMFRYGADHRPARAACIGPRQNARNSISSSHRLPGPEDPNV